MKSFKNVVLVGMMGSGKSTIGYLLSKKLKLEFIDIDNVIEKESGLKINEIFKTKGEIFFRDIEKTITIKAMKQGSKIIALGGGGFINEKIRNEVLSKHISFWLSWPIPTLIKRINKSNKRPIVTNLSEKEIKKLILDRAKIYSLANYKLNCENFSKNEIINKIINIYNEN